MCVCTCVYVCTLLNIFQKYIANFLFLLIANETFCTDKTLFYNGDHSWEHLYQSDRWKNAILNIFIISKIIFFQNNS